MPSKSNSASELRCDPVSGDWVVVAPHRGGRPHTLQAETKKRSDSPSSCPFCAYFDKDDSLSSGGIVVVPNKFPAFSPVGQGQTPAKLPRGLTPGNLFQKRPADGFHEVVITRDHQRQIADLSTDEVYELVNVYQERYLALSKDESVNYVFIFQNQGILAGATIAHPHSQIMTSPVVDCGFEQIIRGSEKFFQKHKKCVYCRMIGDERKSNVRLVRENKGFVALCPFASKISFEVIIIPKKHSPHFGSISQEEKNDLADILIDTLSRIKKHLNNPAYNFYIRTAPCDSAKYPYFHWYLDILPRTQVYAGFELGAFMEIITITPEQAALSLRKIKV